MCCHFVCRHFKQKNSFNNMKKNKLDGNSPVFVCFIFVSFHSIFAFQFVYSYRARCLKQRAKMVEMNSDSNDNNRIRLLLQYIMARAQQKDQKNSTQNGSHDPKCMRKMICFKYSLALASGKTRFAQSKLSSISLSV